jgi:hypothetical protein
MGGTYSTHGGDELCIQFLLNILKGRDHLKDLAEV